MWVNNLITATCDFINLITFWADILCTNRIQSLVQITFCQVFCIDLTMVYCVSYLNIDIMCICMLVLQIRMSFQVRITMSFTCLRFYSLQNTLRSCNSTTLDTIVSRLLVLSCQAGFNYSENSVIFQFIKLLLLLLFNLFYNLHY